MTDGRHMPQYTHEPILTMYRSSHVLKLTRVCTEIDHVPNVSSCTWTTVQKLCNETVCTESVLYRYGSTPIHLASQDNFNMHSGKFLPLRNKASPGCRSTYQQFLANNIG